MNNNGIDIENADPKGKKSILQFIKFALVGASNTIVDMVVSTVVDIVLKLFLSGGFIIYLAKAVGYACGILNSYILNSRWTFREERTRDRREKLSFVAVNIVVLLTSFALIFVFSSLLKLGAWWEGLALPEFVKKIISGERFCSLLATVICLPVNFVLSKLFVFRGGRSA